MKAISSLRTIPLLASAALFLTSLFFDNFTIQSVQPNGLPEIQLPLTYYSWFVKMAATALLLFALCFNLAIRGKETKTFGEIVHATVGSAVFGSGLMLFLFSELYLWMEQTDFSARCETGGAHCGMSLVQSHVLEVQWFSGAIDVGLILTAAGLVFTILARYKLNKSSNKLVLFPQHNLRNTTEVRSEH